MGLGLWLGRTLAGIHWSLSAFGVLAVAFGHHYWLQSFGCATFEYYQGRIVFDPNHTLLACDLLVFLCLLLPNIPL